MNVLHLASFNGNIGDNAHHNGFRASFEEVFSKVKWTELEIRYFYKSWDKLKFDDKFVQLVNQYDLLIIGGGNFFEVCHDYSSTGCTIDLAPDILDKIKIPILFNALGFDIHKGASKNNLKKFHSFISNLSQRNNVLISFRNDGSIENYQKVYGKVDNYIHKIPDGGFFITPNKTNPNKNKFIGINLACDMLEKRLTRLNYADFLLEIKEIYSQIIKNTGYKLRFFPHIFTDLKIIYDLITLFDDEIIKFNIEVMPYVTGQNSEIDFFTKYKECELVTGMRFHTNVCAFGMGIKTVPLITYPKLKALYKDINQEHMLVDVNSDNFKTDYLNKIEQLLTSEYNNQDIVSNLKKDQLAVINKFKQKLNCRNENS